MKKFLLSISMALFVLVGFCMAEPVEDGGFLTQNTTWVDGLGYEQDGQFKTNDVKLFYYTTAGETLINDQTYYRILRTRKCKTSFKLREDNEGNEVFNDKELTIQPDTLCFYMREDEAGNVWLYTKDKNIFYEISHNTLYDYLADKLIGRDLFLFNAKKQYAVGDALLLGASAITDPNGFQNSEDFWHIYSYNVESISERNLLDGKIYHLYNNFFIENIGPIDGPLSGIGSPNSYNLDFRFLLALYRNNRLLYGNYNYLSALEELFPNILSLVTGFNASISVTFTAGQMATIILPSEPDAGKGKYYKLDRVEAGEIVFEQELQPRAHVPYIIVPFEDFSIDPGTLDLAGLKPDTVSVGSISFIGTYVRTELPALTGGDGEWRPFPPSLGGDGGGFYRIIDTTPDCSPLPGEGQGERLAFVGTLRAYLTWDDPYGPGATKGPEEEMKIVLHDRGTGSLSPAPSPEGEGRKDAAIYDLSGKKVNGKWLNGKSPRDIYIKDRKKWVKPFK